MDEFTPGKKSSLPIILAVLLVLVLGAGGYAFIKKQQANIPPPIETAQTQTPELAAPVAPPPTEAQTVPQEKPPVVVATRTLDMPVAASAEPAPSAASKDPAIVAMMAPRTIGKADAPVKITEYSSLTCTHCGAFHRETFEKFKSEFIDTGRVQMTFREFPLNQPALEASQILRCMPEDKFVNFMNLLFTAQDKWAFSDKYKDGLRQNAKLAGMSDDTFDKCLDNKALKEAILGDMKAASDKYKVESTPSFVINNGQKVLIGNQPIDAFDKAITEASTTAAPASTSVNAPTSAPVAAASQAASPETVQPSAADASKTETPSASAADAAVKAAKPTEDETPPPAE